MRKVKETPSGLKFRRARVYVNIPRGRTELVGPEGSHQALTPFFDSTVLLGAFRNGPCIDFAGWNSTLSLVSTENELQKGDHRHTAS